VRIRVHPGAIKSLRILTTKDNKVYPKKTHFNIKEKSNRENKNRLPRTIFKTKQYTTETKQKKLEADSLKKILRKSARVKGFCQ
jgi:hypothetical protein